jgi:hypothetical protein
MNQLSVTNLASFTTDAVFDDGFNQFNLASAINYRTSYTPIINKV